MHLPSQGLGGRLDEGRSWDGVGIVELEIDRGEAPFLHEHITSQPQRRDLEPGRAVWLADDGRWRAQRGRPVVESARRGVPVRDGQELDHRVRRWATTKA